MKYIASIEGQSLPLPEEIASDDAKVKAMLAPYFSWASTAQIVRSEPIDDTITLMVIKKSGQKGNVAGLVKELAKAPASENTAVAMWRRVKDNPSLMSTPPSEETLRLETRIKRALKTGEEENGNVRETLAQLIEMTPEPSEIVPEGF